jgi:hypothetical protein
MLGTILKLFDSYKVSQTVQNQPDSFKTGVAVLQLVKIITLKPCVG